MASTDIISLGPRISPNLNGLAPQSIVLFFWLAGTVLCVVSDDV